MIKLDILSDPICPWCYIGKAQLDRALEAAPAHPFTVEWHPFQLNPEMPAGGMDRRDYLEAKFGGRDGAIEVYSRIATHAEAAGLEINFDRISRTPNTLNAHRLIHWAGLEGRQTPMVAALFRAYFVEGKDIGDAESLVQIAESAGLEAAMVTRLLASDADSEDIRARDANARARGVTGVPTFIIANQHVLTGAQSPDLWSNVIDEISDQLKAKE
ncbi:DsbA family oxidoreductase [Rhodophyticola porphyridii]|uniref:DsbA family oxidoreductase n=1 Tax=Rhodophyticola porphyridii TaxID=1852017 RepID=A0A3L9Y1V8_9RHOB|nr:DsbA family oxidoreductase [Rhodophyticola porphyridii]RMA41405.1 DsbA family oxidoreductase [Rhodophyticola porphyridii]